MSDWNSAASDYLDELARRPAAREGATIGEVWDTEWKRSGLDTIGGVGQPFTEAYDELSRAIEKHGQSDIATLAYKNNINMGAAVTSDQRIAALNSIADTLPEEARKEIEPFRDVRRRAADKAQAIEREASDVYGASSGLSAVATSWLAGIARQTADPFNLAANLATAPLGGPFKGPILKVVARQAVAGGAAQLMVEPYIQTTRGELGLESGFKEGAVNVAQAAIGAGGLAALFRAGKAGFDFLRGPRAAAVQAPLSEAAPNFEPTFLGYMDHEDAAAFNRGEPVTTPHSLAEIPNVPGFARNFDIEAGAGAVPDRSRIPPVRPQEFEPTFRGTLEPDDVAAFDRGHGVATVDPLGEGAPGIGGGFNISEGALARPVRNRAPLEIRNEFEPAFRGTLEPDDVAALERGGPVETPFSLADLPEEGLGGLSAFDFEAAARLAERDHIIDSAAPPSWDRATHAAMVDEAAAALEAGRPIDRAKAAEAITNAGLEAPAVAPVADNVVSEAVKPEPKKKRFGVHNMPMEQMSLFQFLASIGGLHPQDMRGVDIAGRALSEALPGGGMTGELKHILDGNPFVPGFGRLLRKTGRSLEQARAAAEEAGYLPAKSSINDFLGLVSQEAGGDRVYRAGFERVPELDPREQKALRERAAEARAADFDARMVSLEISKVTKADRKRALQIMEKEGQADPLLAYEQALSEKELRKEKLRERRLQEQDLRIPGFDDEIPFGDVADDAGPASKVGRDLEGGAGSRSGEPGAGGATRGTGEGARAPGEESQLGDPALAADAERAIAAAGDDFQTVVHTPDGYVVKAKPAELLKAADDEARAATELFDCIGVSVRPPELNPIPGQRLKPFTGGGE